jgi:hypothetical protein
LSWLIISVLLSANIGEAQSDWQRVINLAPGTPITVNMKAGDEYHGSFVTAAMGDLSLDSDERAHPGRVIRRRDLTRGQIHEVRRLDKARSALAAAAIGGGVGVGIGVAVDSAARTNEDRRVATIVFPFFGAVLGWLIGRHTSLVKGETIYVAP